MKSPTKCLFVAPSGTANTLFQQIVVPAANNLGLVPVPVDEDSDVHSHFLDGVSVVVIDSLADWTHGAGHALGLAQGLKIPYLVLIEAIGSNTHLLATTNRVILDVDYNDNSSVDSASKTFQEALTNQIRLPNVPSTPATPPRTTSSSTAKFDAEAIEPMFDMKSAERLLIELFLDGLSEHVIEQELLRLGAPASWVRNRLHRRPGW